MNYQEEIREIRKMLNEGVVYNDNYAHKRTDEELQDGVSYFSTKNTGLSKDIIVDTGENYKYYNHPLCLYIVGKEDDVYPVTISNTPKSPTEIEIPVDIIVFIQNSIKPLSDVANIEIGAFDFIDYLKNYREQIANSKLVGEMANLPPKDTGLLIWVYVDDTGSYLKSGHNGSYRIKFQQDKSLKQPKMWMPMLIPSLEIMDNGKLPSIKIAQKEIEDVRAWAKGNLALLDKLKKLEIDGDCFRNSMKTLDDIKVILDSEINDVSNQ